MEQRIKEKMEWLTNECTSFTLERPYNLIKTALTNIATEQKAIDINKACSIIESLNWDISADTGKMINIDAFRKAMEE